MKNLKFPIIPLPYKLEEKKGFFTLNEDTRIFTDECFNSLANSLNQQITQDCGFELPIILEMVEKEVENVITFKFFKEGESLEKEVYILDISPDSIVISSSEERGIYYGIQTLRQLWSFQKEDSMSKNIWKIPCGKIEDHPRFSWRGFMLDEARHIFGKDEVKKILDIMASYKFNIFHWHLTDDQGWRVQIKKYPLLIEIGSKRKGTSTRKRRLMADRIKGDLKLDGVPVSGYYTQEDLKEIVEYAHERFIKVIPEIDLPGHTRALLAAYPELSCTGGPFEVSPQFGVHKDVLCIGKEKSLSVSKDILNEIIEIFPSDIIHIGGDEVPTHRWMKCPDCQELMKLKHFDKETQIQAYYTNEIARFLLERNKTLMGWNEILNSDLEKNAIAQFWAGDFNYAIDHVKNGRKTVMSEMNSVYLNYRGVPLSQTYSYDPIPDNLEEKYHANILGIEGCLWSEYYPNTELLETALFPRLIAIAETGWSPRSKKELKDFISRLEIHLPRFRVKKIHFTPLDEKTD